MFVFVKEWGLYSLTVQAVFFRIFLSLVLGGLLGVERSKKGRAAGFRTYILVCMGAASVMMTSQYILEYLGLTTDPTRLGAQVVSGVGFLGAGTIIMTGSKRVQGLTTAAGLWASGCMGLAIGIGFYLGAVAMCVSMLAVMTVFDLLETRFFQRNKYICILVEFNTFESISKFMKIAEDNRMSIEGYEVQRLREGSGISASFTFRFDKDTSTSALLEAIRQCDGMTYAEKL